jgi:hypothetical protein
MVKLGGVTLRDAVHPLGTESLNWNVDELQLELSLFVT